MLRTVHSAGLLAVLMAAAISAGPETGQSKPDMSWLWIDPTDLESRDLYYGLGSKDRAPHGTEFKFVEEDLDGLNPKIVVTDADGLKWKVKFGLEAQSEVAATRLVWAAGFHTHEDYLFPELHVTGLPAKLHRGNNLIGPGGVIANVRMRRHREHEKKVGWWEWNDNPFKGTREFNGLRTMMAVLNNWDLKDVNTAIWDNTKSNPSRPVRMYMASDLGSSFGSTNLQWRQEKIKNNLEHYEHSKFVIDNTPETVSFSVPGNFRFYNATYVQYFYRRQRIWITRDIPRQDAKWLGTILARLSPAQIRAAFRAANYSPEEVEGFAKVVERRIAELNSL